MSEQVFKDKILEQYNNLLKCQCSNIELVTLKTKCNNLNYFFKILIKNKNKQVKDKCNKLLLELIEERPVRLLILLGIYDINLMINNFGYEKMKNIFSLMPVMLENNKLSFIVKKFINSNINYEKFSLELIKTLLKATKIVKFYYDIYLKDISKRNDQVDLYKLFLEYDINLPSNIKNFPNSVYESELEVAIISERIENVTYLVEAGVKLPPVNKIVDYIVYTEITNFKELFNTYIEDCFIRLKYKHHEFKTILTYDQTSDLKYIDCFVKISDKYLNVIDKVESMREFILKTNFTQIKNNIMLGENKVGDIVIYYLYRIKDGEDENSIYIEMLQNNHFILNILGINTVEKMSYLNDFIQF